MAFEFKFADKFPSLVQDDFDNAYDEVITRYAGVPSLWASLESTIRDNKRELCLNYLVGWYLADLYPLEAQNISGTGGMPLSSKSIGGTSISYLDMKIPDDMKELTSNAFGLKAAGMILSSPERFGIYGGD
jgi:hypothetical protein